ncbi:GNAT family N-acetyltransferase [Motilimonas sp. KMU-193]|uniref:GNAT family N-acetyltransferase n=1 Tax=Motilimonas sp. KMU-193 TaxID=3388668 RepID=UPI00396B2549
MDLELTYAQVDLNKSLAICLGFRKDAYKVSYGHDAGYSEHETVEWFEYLSEHNPSGFLHVMAGDEIIGQLEFKAGLELEDARLGGYVNLFYLDPDWRGLGIGK